MRAIGKIAVVGHLCVDLKPTLDGPPVLDPGVLAQVGPATVSLGGSVANTGRVLAVLGAPVVAWGAVGRDDFGAIVQRHLASVPGLEFRPAFVEVGTAYTIVVEPPGTNRLFWHYPGSNGSLDLAGISLEGVDLVHFGYPSLMPGVCADGGAGLVEFLAAAAASGVVTSLDLAWVDRKSSAGQVDWAGFLQRVLPVTDIVSPSYDDLASALGLPVTYEPRVARELVEQLLEWGASVVMMTSGPNELLLGAADRLERLRRFVMDPMEWAGARAALPAPALARVTTTTGAGDAATAGLLLAIRDGRGPEAALRHAAAVAAAVIEQGGTQAFAGLAE